MKILLVSNEYPRFGKAGNPIIGRLKNALESDERVSKVEFCAENGGYPPTQNGDIRSLFWLFSLMALQN